MTAKWESNGEIQIFREYLRIPTVQPNVNYGKLGRYLIAVFHSFFRTNQLERMAHFHHFLQMSASIS